MAHSLAMHRKTCLAFILCRCGLESNVLRFLARMDTTKPIDMDRRFIISYFLADDTLLVFEPPVRNSGKKFMLMSITTVLDVI